MLSSSTREEKEWEKGRKERWEREASWLSYAIENKRRLFASLR
jgi:hypothetical protein